MATGLGALYHGYRQVRNRKVNEALIQGVETARAVLETTSQGQEANAQCVSTFFTPSPVMPVAEKGHAVTRFCAIASNSAMISSTGAEKRICLPRLKARV